MIGGRIRFWSTTVGLTLALAQSLGQLVSSIDGEQGSLVQHIDAVVDEVRRVVPAYCGLRLTVYEDGYPVTLTAFGGGSTAPVVASLRVPLPAGPERGDQSGEIVLYARVLGAFAAAADDIRADGAQVTVILDQDLPPASQVSGLSGLSALSAANLAAGVLIARGHHPDEVHDTLRRQAARAGFDPEPWAVRVLSDHAPDHRRGADPS